MKPLLNARRSPGFVPLQPGHIQADRALCDCPASPTVEIIREGGKVVRLVVTCACGEKIEVECLYAAGS
jgi:hypothetical protein